jgi:hypothetical protein
MLHASQPRSFWVQKSQFVHLRLTALHRLERPDLTGRAVFFAACNNSGGLGNPQRVGRMDVSVGLTHA